jgi:hypothetical protein
MIYMNILQPSYFSLFDVHSPPSDWPSSEFIEALHILSRFTRDELQEIVEEIFPDEISFQFPLSARTLLVQIFAYYSPQSFFYSVHSKESVIGRRILRMLT